MARKLVKKCSLHIMVYKAKHAVRTNIISIFNNLLDNIKVVEFITQ